MTSSVQALQPAPIVQEVKLDTPAQIESYIHDEAIEKGIDPVHAQSIAWAESHFNKEARNASSTASGVWQFLNGTFSDYCIKKYQLTDTLEDKNDVAIQTECALRMLDAGGESHWSPSKANWSKYKPIVQS